MVSTKVQAHQHKMGTQYRTVARISRCCFYFLLAATVSGIGSGFALGALIGAAAGNASIKFVKAPKNFKILTALATTAIVSGGGGYATIEYSAQNPYFGVSPVELTTGEAAFVQGIFNNAVDTSIVRKHLSFEKHKDNANAAAYGRRDVVFYGNKHHESDYSKTTNDYNVTAFAHEMTHIWQRQTDRKFTNTARDKRLMERFKNKKHVRKDYKSNLYFFGGNDITDFKKFGAEQQATIIGNYTRRFLRYPAVPSSVHYEKPHYAKDDTPESDLYLKNIVEDFFPQARKTRLAFETKHYKSNTFDKKKTAVSPSNYNITLR